jgi:hypothetical protein
MSWKQHLLKEYLDSMQRQGYSWDDLKQMSNNPEMRDRRMVINPDLIRQELNVLFENYQDYPMADNNNDSLAVPREETERYNYNRMNRSEPVNNNRPVMQPRPSNNMPEMNRESLYRPGHGDWSTVRQPNETEEERRLRLMNRGY